MMNARIALASLMFTACVDQPEDLDDLELGTTESNLCSDGAPDATIAFVNGTEQTSTSALSTNNYDHPACSDRYTVEFTGTGSATHPIDVFGGWGEGLPETQSACELAVANVQTHEYTQGWTCGGGFCWPTWSWKQVGADVSHHGEWKPFFDSFYCDLVPNSPLPTLAPTAMRTKIRVAVRAYGWALFFPAYKRGMVGINSSVSP